MASPAQRTARGDVFLGRSVCGTTEGLIAGRVRPAASGRSLAAGRVLRHRRQFELPSAGTPLAHSPTRSVGSKTTTPPRRRPRAGHSPGLRSRSACRTWPTTTRRPTSPDAARVPHRPRPSPPAGPPPACPRASRRPRTSASSMAAKRSGSRLAGCARGRSKSIPKRAASSSADTPSRCSTRGRIERVTRPPGARLGGCTSSSPQRDDPAATGGR
jgi:hypothetical protein